MPPREVKHVMKVAAMSRSRYLYGLDRVPEERLSWSPGGEANSPLKLAGRAVRFVDVFAHLLQHGAVPESARATPPPVPQSREEAKRIVEEAYERLRGVLNSLSEADLEKPMPVPWGGTVPLSQMLFFFAVTLGYQQGQLNYAQMAYGDKDANIPPGWGHDTL
jgi:hypothetical protein